MTVVCAQNSANQNRACIPIDRLQFQNKTTAKYGEHDTIKLHVSSLDYYYYSTV